MRWIALIFLLASTIGNCLSQDSLSVQPKAESIVKNTKADTLEVRLKKDKIPNRAAIYSLVLPGAGQVYNGRIWKVPIVYAALGTSFYFIRTNRDQYHRFRDAFLLRIDGDDGTVDEFVDVIPTSEGLKSYRDQARRYMEISYFSFGFVWLLNSIEAYVDCHLLHFDISEDLSLDLATTPYPGITLKYDLGKAR